MDTDEHRFLQGGERRGTEQEQTEGTEEAKGRFSGFSMALLGPTTEKPLKRFNQSQQRTITPLKRGVNETQTVQPTGSRASTPLKRGVNETGPRTVYIFPYSSVGNPAEKPNLKISVMRPTSQPTPVLSFISC